MLIRVPDYYEAFHCLAGACPHTCCEKWEVVMDEETARRYQDGPRSTGRAAAGAAHGAGRGGGLLLPPPGRPLPLSGPGEPVRDPPDTGSRRPPSVTCREPPPVY